MKEMWLQITSWIREEYILLAVLILDSIVVAYGIVNRQTMSDLAWALLVGIVLSLVIFAIALTKAMRHGFAGRWVAILVLAVGFLFLLYLAYNLREIEAADWAQIMLTFALVAVTLLSAMSATRQASASRKMAEATKEQADANTKMATEMQNQRYDTFRPVLDIRMNPLLVTSKKPIKITYEINNIGVGPALDGHLLTPEPKKIDLGTLTTIRDSDAIGDYGRGTITIQKENLPGTIIAYYKDVFSRSFKSEREICLAIEENDVTFGTLRHCKLDRDKDSDLIGRIWSPSKKEVNQND